MAEVISPQKSTTNKRLPTITILFSIWGKRDNISPSYLEGSILQKCSVADLKFVITHNTHQARLQAKVFVIFF